MTPSVVGEKAEGPYVTAKTSVWWDIENCHVPKRFDAHSIAQNISSALVSLNYCGPVSISAYGDSNRIPPAVQQALNSTGISLNHVPAGVKDASDKKILVDMLFWAVDNPAPANYLLISGDRDFSNALHQLRMRRYNILLGQPKQTSAALIAAAKIVWSWNSLISGGPPLSSGDIPEFVDDANSKFNPEIVQGLVQNNTPKIHPVNLKPEDGDASKPKIVLNSPKQPTTRTQSIPVWIQKNKVQPESALAKQFNIAPHEFFRASDANPASSSAENIYPNDSDQSKNQDKLNSIQCLQPRAIFSPHNFYAPDSSNNGFRPMVQKPDTSQFSWTPSVSENNNYTWKPKISEEKFGSNVKPKSLETPDLAMPYLPTHGAGDLHTRQPISFPMLNYTNSKVFEVPTMSTSSKNNSTGDIHGVQTCKLPSESIQGLIWIILAALDTLKKDKLIPTEANIKDCICYGDPKFQNTDVDKALSLALEQQMISMKRVGSVELYLGKNERLWNCVNPIGGGNPNIYSKATWDGIQKFLSSSAGSSAIMSSKCRYEAASILKNACLKEYVLGEVLQILNMIATIKQWITHSKSGWQPVSVTIAES